MGSKQMLIRIGRLGFRTHPSDNVDILFMLLFFFFFVLDIVMFVLQFLVIYVKYIALQKLVAARSNLYHKNITCNTTSDSFPLFEAIQISYY